MYYSIQDSLEHIGKTITLKGWVRNQRDMSKILFIDLVDHTGTMQIVAFKNEELPKLGNEYVVAITGELKARSEKMVNPNIPTGHVELKADSVSIISASAELPFELREDTLGINEELRLKHRYLDLRTERMTANLKLRHQVIRHLRSSLDDQDFTEVETPMLTKGTPEGSREFLVPSRLHPEEFYVLPQSPQQFKQLLMVGGLGRYYQIAKCLRDEDQRGDRQPEFTQLDIEASFVEQEDILALNEQLLISLADHLNQNYVDLLPNKKPLHLTHKTFPRLTYAKSMKQYGTDKPNLRKDTTDPNELAFVWITDFPMFEINNETNKTDAVHHPFTAPLPADAHLIESKPMDVRAAAYDVVLNGYEIGGGSIRIHDRDLQTKVFELLGLGKDDIQSRFGHMLDAFSYGVPPHGGIAYGLDRLVMILAGEPNIREVIAFPKTGDARDPLTGAPSAASDQALADAHIKTLPPKKS